MFQTAVESNFIMFFMESFSAYSALLTVFYGVISSGLTRFLNETELLLVLTKHDIKIRYSISSWWLPAIRGIYKSLKNESDTVRALTILDYFDRCNRLTYLEDSKNNKYTMPAVEHQLPL